MNTIDYFKERFDRLKSLNGNAALNDIRKEAFNSFSAAGIPSVKHEEWKYTRIGAAFNVAYEFPISRQTADIAAADLDAIRLPGYENANELVFINGKFSPPHSVIRSPELLAMPLEEAANDDQYRSLISTHLGHSAKYLKDGINALNTAFILGGIFIHVKKDKTVSHPTYIYNIADARSVNVLAQPRMLAYIGENAEAEIVQTYTTLGAGESFTNQVIEIIVDKDARVSYYKIQNDSSHANQVSATHIRQIGKSYVHTATISLSGAIVRNNLNIILEAEYSEAHLYGLYFQEGNTHVDNHTLVDNIKPNCLSNELYKGILNDTASGVFNGKIYVQPDAQKTNAYQSNKNVLLSDTASMNTKPQLEIFADNVKCSHGCTIGRLNEEGLFYLQSRGISIKKARALLLQAYAVDIIEQIKLDPIRGYIERLISERLEFDIA